MKRKMAVTAAIAMIVASMQGQTAVNTSLHSSALYSSGGYGTSVNVSTAQSGWTWKMFFARLRPEAAPAQVPVRGGATDSHQQK